MRRVEGQGAGEWTRRRRTHAASRTRARLRPRTVTATTSLTVPKLSVPPSNLAMKPEPRPPIHTASGRHLQASAPGLAGSYRG